MKILNLFAGIGGNRTLWGDEYEITAVEFDPDIAAIYQERFPRDVMIVEDAYKYLEKHYFEYDFIWASPPCQTHTQLVPSNVAQGHGKLPDLQLYSIIIYLHNFCKSKWVVENVKPYYAPLISPSVILGRHYYWSNFNIPDNPHLNRPLFRGSSGGTKIAYEKLVGFHNIQFKEKIPAQYLRNCVDYRIGKYILNCALKQTQQTMKKFL